MAIETDIRIRQSNATDLPALVVLEQTAFTIDRFTVEHIDYMLSRARATIFVAELEGKVVGAAYILWRKNASNGRLYNFAVEPLYQNLGIGTKLLNECEVETARRGYHSMNLEVRPDNEKGIQFYEKYGYQAYKQTPNFYEDGAPAIRMKKKINAPLPDHVRHKVPYFPQSLGFTCGPACLMMAMKFFLPEGKYNRVLEMNLWKEATLIFMTSGIGGTDPFGIALAATKRNFEVRILSSTEKTPFVRSVRIPEKKAVIRLVHADMKHRAQQQGVSFTAYDYGFEEIRSALLQNLIPITLISTYRLTGFREPHWVVVTGFDSDFVYLHDPYEKSEINPQKRSRNIRIEHQEFLRMSRYGKEVYRCTIFIGKPQQLLNFS